MKPILLTTFNEVNIYIFSCCKGLWHLDGRSKKMDVPRIHLHRGGYQVGGALWRFLTLIILAVLLVLW